MKKSIEIFFSYAQADEELRERLSKHLRVWEKQGLLSSWHAQAIDAGTERQHEIDRHLNAAEIILLLISPDYIASDYLHDHEVARAMQRQRSGDAHVLPIILRPVNWKDAAFGELQSFPEDGKPIVSQQNMDEAFQLIAEQIKLLAENLLKKQAEEYHAKLRERAETYYAKGQTLISATQYKEALVAYEQAILVRAFDPDPRFYHGKATVYEQLARQAHDRALEIHAKKFTLLHELKEHSDKVTSIALSSDGKTLVSGSYDKTIRVWNVQTGQTLYKLEGHSNGVRSVAISSDGQMLASGSYDQTIRIWNARTGQFLRTLKGHNDVIANITLSPDGQTLVSSSMDKTIKVWNLQTGQHLRTLEGHNDVIANITLSPDGQMLVGVSIDKTIKMWNLQTGQHLRTLEGHLGPIAGIALSPDGQTLVSGSADKTIKIWNMYTGQLLRTLKAHDASVMSLAISRDGQMLVSGSWDQTVKLWNLQTGQLLRTLEGHSGVVRSVALSTAGQILASGSEDKTIRIWKTQ
ncbi:MAG TPA: TIR domain-containing protein [Ktedonobacteraceae bacterium]